MPDKRVSKNIWRTHYGWRLFARIKGTLKPKRVHDPHHDLTLEELKVKRDEWKVAARGPIPPPRKATPGTFADDVQRYLLARRAMPGIVARTKLMDLWIAEFGDRVRSTIEPWEIATVRDRWLTEGPKWVYRDKKRVLLPLPLSASQVCNRLRALENLWTVLDGTHAYNPVREVTEPQEPEAPVRRLAYGVIAQILAAMPDQRYRRKLSGDDIAAIRTALTRRRVNQTTLARKYGVSEAMIRKVGTGAPRKPEAAALTKLRLAVIAYTGFSHGELMAITATDLHLDATPPWVWIRGRSKGKGTQGQAQPLTAKGAAALRALVDAKGLGAFSPASMRASFLRALRRLHLPHARPYDLRHSFASEVLERTGNPGLTRLLMRHKDDRTTLRYGKGAVPKVLGDATRALDAGGAFAPEPRVTLQPQPR